MDINDILTDKQSKPKEKVQAMGKLLLEGELTAGELIDYARDAKDAPKGTCIEAIELATRDRPDLVDGQAFDFMIQCLTAKVPRVKWESAKVIANTAHLHPGKLDRAVGNLLDNTTHPGTVVRWAAAYALGQIARLGTDMNADLVPALEAIVKREDNNGVRRLYLDTLRKLGKQALPGKI